MNTKPERPPVVVVHAQGVVDLLERLAVRVAGVAAWLDRRFPPAEVTGTDRFDILRDERDA